MESASKKTSKEIDDIAAAWVARGDAGSLNPEEIRELQAWQAADPRHLGAFVRAQAIYIHTERAAALGSKFGADVTANVAAAPQDLLRVSRRHLIWSGASAAAAAGIGAVALRTLYVPTARFATLRGEIRTVPLDDGSVMMLNTASSVAVGYTRSNREIELFEGEVLFDVAIDVHRPFRVTSGGTEVVARGTQFSIRHLAAEPTTILVEEGVVDVSQKTGQDVHSAQLTAHMRAISLPAAAGGGLVTTSLDPSVVESEMAWRQGMLAFRGTTLADAVRQFDRYGDSKIVIADPVVGSIPITGLFSAYRPTDFIETIALTLSLRLERNASGVVVRRPA